MRSGSGESNVRGAFSPGRTMAGLRACSISVASGNLGSRRRVEGVPEDGRPQVSHVHAQLVGASRPRRKQRQGCSRRTTDRFSSEVTATPAAGRDARRISSCFSGHAQCGSPVLPSASAASFDDGDVAFSARSGPGTGAQGNRGRRGFSPAMITPEVSLSSL